MNEIENLQNKLEEMLSDFHSFCVEHGLRYYLAGGTMLGAIRHKGFIPWDDDVDVTMPEKDYLKFIKLSSKLNKYEVKSRFNTSKYEYMHTKIYDPNTTFVEKRGDKEIIYGVFLDVFPLLGFGSNLKKAKKKGNMLNFLHKILGISQSTGKIESKRGKYSKSQLFIANLAAKFIRLMDSDKLADKLEKKAFSGEYESSKYIGICFGVYGGREVMDKEIFGTPRLYQFGNIKVYGAENADLFLKSLYGDYMKLPEKHLRVIQHAHYYNINLPYKEYISMKINSNCNDEAEGKNGK